MKRYYFIDKKTDSKVELFNVNKKENNGTVYYTGFDENGNEYSIEEANIIIEEE